MQGTPGNMPRLQSQDPQDRAYQRSTKEGRMTMFCKREELPDVPGFYWQFYITASEQGAYALTPRSVPRPTAFQIENAETLSLSEWLRTHADAAGYTPLYPDPSTRLECEAAAKPSPQVVQTQKDGEK
jgi:hypothetical protein